VGSCKIDADCSNPNNDFPHMMCIGFANCNESGECSYTCT
jgi:hypothetical protein